jgi:hypothetical protein
MYIFNHLSGSSVLQLLRYPPLLIIHSRYANTHKHAIILLTCLFKLGAGSEKRWLCRGEGVVSTEESASCLKPTPV